MIKILATADWHLKLSESLGIGNTYGINDRLLDKIEMAHKIVGKAIELKVDYLFILGDLFDRPNPSEKLRQIFINIIKPLYSSDINVKLISGNHGNDDWESYCLMSESSLGLITNDGDPFFVTYFSLGDLLLSNFYNDEDSMCVTILPDEKTEDLLKYLEEAKQDIAFGHLGVKGSVMNNGIIDNDGIPLEKFKNFKKVFLGHIHKPQDVGNCHYVGAPWANKIDELGYGHSITYIELATNGDKSKFERIEVDEKLMVITYPLSLGKSNYEMVKGGLLQHHDKLKRIARIIVKGNRNDLNLLTFDFGKLKKELLEAGYYDVRIKYILTDDRVEQNEIDLDSDENLIEKSMDNYFKEKNTSKELISIANNIMKESYAIKEA